MKFRIDLQPENLVRPGDLSGPDRAPRAAGWIEDLSGVIYYHAEEVLKHPDGLFGHVNVRGRRVGDGVVYETDDLAVSAGAEKSSLVDVPWETINVRGDPLGIGLVPDQRPRGD